MRSKTHQAKHNNIKSPNIGAVLEWLKRHAWKGVFRGTESSKKWKDARVAEEADLESL